LLFIGLSIEQALKTTVMQFAARGTTLVSIGGNDETGEFKEGVRKMEGEYINHTITGVRYYSPKIAPKEGNTQGCCMLTTNSSNLSKKVRQYLYRRHL
jgi:hypothetical protein